VSRVRGDTDYRCGLLACDTLDLTRIGHRHVGADDDSDRAHRANAIAREPEVLCADDRERRGSAGAVSRRGFVPPDEKNKPPTASSTAHASIM
jgi:hypothetical protein